MLIENNGWLVVEKNNMSFLNTYYRDFEDEIVDATIFKDKEEAEKWISNNINSIERDLFTVMRIQVTYWLDNYEE